MNRITNLIAILSFIVAAGCGHYVATQPSQAVVIIPPSPGPEYVWVNGNWRWNGGAHVYNWNNGYWAAQRGHAAWVDGRWASTQRGWKYVPGHWR